ncbi:hypothetical protein LMG18101_05069 [Ralstonia flaminis]|uniref:Uncharacterized protein n=1 Tax=Ralstonia flaminis TaxID=3058597 RepID=A0ABN9JTL4_9RALS|nr:hypothetical protein LMG18101_05069 [Ralstonia sp. LMG 18101]
MRVGEAVAVLVVGDGVALLTNVARRVHTVHHDLAVHRVVLEVPANIRAIVAVHRVLLDVRAVAHVVVLERDVHLTIGHIAQAVQCVVAQEVVLIHHAALHGLFANVVACQVVGIRGGLVERVVLNRGQLACGVIAVVERLAARVALPDELTGVVVGIAVDRPANIGVARDLAKVVVRPGRRHCRRVHLGNLAVERVICRTCRLAQRLRDRKNVAAQVVGVARRFTRAVGLAQETASLIVGVALRHVLPALALQLVGTVDGSHFHLRMRGRQQSVGRVVVVLGHQAHRIDGGGLVAEGVVAVVHHAAIRMQLGRDVAAGIVDLAVDVAVGIHHRHLAAQRVVCRTRNGARAGLITCTVWLALFDDLVVGVVAIRRLPVRRTRIADLGHVAPAVYLLVDHRACPIGVAVRDGNLAKHCTCLARAQADRRAGGGRHAGTVLRGNRANEVRRRIGRCCGLASRRRRGACHPDLLLLRLPLVHGVRHGNGDVSIPGVVRAQRLVARLIGTDHHRSVIERPRCSRHIGIRVSRIDRDLTVHRHAARALLVHPHGRVDDVARLVALRNPLPRLVGDHDRRPLRGDLHRVVLRGPADNLRLLIRHRYDNIALPRIVRAQRLLARLVGGDHHRIRVLGLRIAADVQRRVRRGHRYRHLHLHVAHFIVSGALRIERQGTQPLGRAVAAAVCRNNLVFVGASRHARHIDELVCRVTRLVGAVIHHGQRRPGTATLRSIQELNVARLRRPLQHLGRGSANDVAGLVSLVGRAAISVGNYLSTDHTVGQANGNRRIVDLRHPVAGHLSNLNELARRVCVRCRTAALRPQQLEFIRTGTHRRRIDAVQAIATRRSRQRLPAGTAACRAIAQRLHNVVARALPGQYASACCTVGQRRANRLECRRRNAHAAGARYAGHVVAANGNDLVLIVARLQVGCVIAQHITKAHQRQRVAPVGRTGGCELQIHLLHRICRRLHLNGVAGRTAAALVDDLHPLALCVLLVHTNMRNLADAADRANAVLPCKRGAVSALLCAHDLRPRPGHARHRNGVSAFVRAAFVPAARLVVLIRRGYVVDIHPDLTVAQTLQARPRQIDLVGTSPRGDARLIGGGPGRLHRRRQRHRMRRHPPLRLQAFGACLGNLPAECVVLRIGAARIAQRTCGIRAADRRDIDIVTAHARAADVGRGIAIGVEQRDAIYAVAIVGAPQVAGAVVVEVLLAPPVDTLAHHFAKGVVFHGGIGNTGLCLCDYGHARAVGLRGAALPFADPLAVVQLPDADVGEAAQAAISGVIIRPRDGGAARHLSCTKIDRTACRVRRDTACATRLAVLVRA